jgi:hypothetical protein
MTQADFSAKWDRRFKDNVDFIISEADLREFKDDCLLVFGAGANAGASAQLLGLDPATGEFLVLLSPAAPKTESSYALAEYAAPPGAGYALRPLPVGAGLAGRILRLPASVAGQTLCLLDAQGEPVPLQHLEHGGDSIWRYVGNQTDQSFSIGELDLTRNSFDTSGLNEGNLFYSGPTVEDNTVGPAFSFNSVRLDFRRNRIGENCFDNDFQFSFTDNELGDNVNACYFDAGTQYVQVGDNCERLSFYNCKGTPQQPFRVPAGTVDAIFRNNQLEIKANEDGRFDLLTPTDRAVPESSIRGAINWRYLTIGAVAQWDVEPGRSVMLQNGCNMRITPDVVEGDIFGVYINPANPKTRIVLSTTAPGGIDGETAKRYTKGASIVFRYALFPSYLDANNNTIPARYGLQTLQHSPPTAVNNRGAFAPSTYYLPGDLVSLNNVLYLRQVEGSDTGALDPSKWAGGGGGTAAPDGTLPLTLMRNADYTLALDDVGCLVPVNSASAVVITVPSHADVAIPVGATLYVAQDGAGAVSIAPAPGVVLRTADGYKVGGQWLDVALHKRNLNTWVLKGGVS